MIKGFEDLKVVNPLTEPKDPVAPRVPWFTEPKFYRSSNPSPLQMWWETESAKRSRGLENEIDINDIKAAMKGVKNKWSKAIELNPDLFKPLSDSGNGLYHWQEILDAKKCSLDF